MATLKQEISHVKLTHSNPPPPSCLINYVLLPFSCTVYPGVEEMHEPQCDNDMSGRARSVVVRRIIVTGRWSLVLRKKLHTNRQTSKKLQHRIRYADRGANHNRNPNQD